MEKIREFRKKANLTLAELGEKVGVSLRTIFNYETGARKPNIDMLRKLAKALNCTVGELISE